MLAGVCRSVLLTRSPLAWPNEPGRHMHMILSPAGPVATCLEPDWPAPFCPGVGQWTWALVSPLVPRGPCSLAWYCGEPGPGCQCALCSVWVGWPRALSQLLLSCGLQLVLLCSAVGNVRGPEISSRVRSDIHVRAASVCYSVRV